MIRFPFLRKIITTLTIFVLIVSFVVLPPRQAYATDGGAGFTLVAKEYGLDLIANLIAKGLIRTMSKQIVNWIQGGNGKNVGFVDNLTSAVKHELDLQEGEFLNGLTGINLCGDLRPYLKLRLGVPRQTKRDLRCSASAIVDNVNKFFNNFSQGGWPAFFRISLQPQNNPYGALMIALDAQAAAQDEKKQSVVAGYQTGGGFLGFRTTKTTCEPADANSLASDIRTFQESGLEDAELEGELEALGYTFDEATQAWVTCTTEKVTKTPGRAIADSLSKTLNVGYDFAVVADEINEAISNIISALTNRLIAGSSGSGGQGIFGDSFDNIPDVSAEHSFATSRLNERIIQARQTMVLVDQKIATWETELETCAANNSPCDTGTLRRNIADYHSKEQELQHIIEVVGAFTNKMASGQIGPEVEGEAGRVASLIARLDEIVKEVGGPPPVVGTPIASTSASQPADTETTAQTFIRLSAEISRADAAIQILGIQENTAMQTALNQTASSTRYAALDQFDGFLVARSHVIDVANGLVAHFAELNDNPTVDHITATEQDITRSSTLITNFLRDAGIDAATLLLPSPFTPSATRTSIVKRHAESAIKTANDLIAQVDLLNTLLTAEQKSTSAITLATLAARKKTAQNSIDQLQIDMASLADDRPVIPRLQDILDDISFSARQHVEVDNLIKTVLAPAKTP